MVSQGVGQDLATKQQLHFFKGSSENKLNTVGKNCRKLCYCTSESSYVSIKLAIKEKRTTYMIHTCKPSTLNQDYVRGRKGLLFQVLFPCLLCLDSVALLTPLTSCPSLCRAEILLRLKTLLPKFLVITFAHT